MSTPTTTPTTIKSLSDTEFEDRYGCNRFTASVIRNRLRYAVEHMSTGLLREAFSPIIRDWYDFACTIAGPPEQDYPMTSVSNSLVVFLGTMADAVRNAVVEFGPENLGPGDVLIVNDPYRAGNHVNDVCFIRPVFHDGKLRAFINLRAHQLDIGGVVPAGFSATKLNIYENGLVLPPLLLFKGGEPVNSTFSLIFDNSRMGEVLLPDFLSVNQQLKLGEQLVVADIERYGADAVLGTFRYACDTSAEAMATALTNLPDGDYSGSAVMDADAIDDSEEYRFCVTLHKRGDQLEADISGTSRQARTSINATALDAKTALGVALTMLLDPSIPFTSGSWRNLDLVAPPGSILSSRPPTGPTMMFWEASGTMVAAVADALKDILGARAIGGDYGSTNVHNANGVNLDGMPFSSVAETGGEHGPWPATKDGDGDSYTVNFTLNNLDPATEAIEHYQPVVLLRKEITTDTGGPGTKRGGAAIVKDTLWRVDAEHFCSPFRTKSGGMGTYSGRDGKAGGVWIFGEETIDVPRDGLVSMDAEVYRDTVPVAGVLDPDTHVATLDGVYHHFASQQWRTTPGAMFRYITNGGGGWGDPLRRDPDAVKRDVRDGYVSVEGARRDYGVVVIGDPDNDPEGLVVDAAETDRLRAGRTAAAGR
jgi:N-methylhydantoinase B